MTLTRPRLFAHRGSSLLAPENTAPAFDLALSFGADVLETDVRLSRDGVPMVFHDATLMRTTDGDGAVRGYRADELCALDAGCRFRALDGTHWTGDSARLLRLDELLARYPTIGINIDIKDADTQAAEAVADVLARHSDRAGITVGSFHAAVLARFRQRAPRVPTAATRAEVARLYFGFQGAAVPRYAALQIPARYAGCNLASPRFVRTVQRHALELVYWTINDAPRMRALAAAGAHGLVTDRIDIARTLWPLQDEFTARPAAASA